MQADSEATLHCGNAKLGQEQCRGTTWNFSGKTSTAVELFQYGKIKEDVKEKFKILTWSKNCSLVIKKVTAEDAGSYTCQQWKGTEETTTGDVQLAEDSVVDLSVVTGE